MSKRSFGFGEVFSLMDFCPVEVFPSKPQEKRSSNKPTVAGQFSISIGNAKITVKTGGKKKSANGRR